VRPHLEYGCHVWDPNDKRLLENVQKFALRICAKQWDLGYDELMISLKVPSLQNRRLYHKLCTMYKIVHNLISFPLSVFVPHPNSHYANTFIQPFARTNSFLHSYVPSTISTWNSLPSNITNAPSVCTFKTHLANHCFV